MVNKDKSSSLKEMYNMQGVVKELFTSSAILGINMIYRLSITFYLGTLHRNSMLASKRMDYYQYCQLSTSSKLVKLSIRQRSLGIVFIHIMKVT